MFKIKSSTGDLVIIMADNSSNNHAQDSSSLF